MIHKSACTTELTKQNHSVGVKPSNLIFNNFKDNDYTQLNFEPLFWTMDL